MVHPTNDSVFKLVNDNSTIFPAIRVYVTYVLSFCDNVLSFYRQV